MSNLRDYEREALEILAGEREGSWGAWLGAVCESLHAQGYCTHEFGGDITEAGRHALTEAQVSSAASEDGGT